MNASCFQYDGSYLCELPHTGFPAAAILLIGVLILLVGIVLRVLR